MKQDDRILTSLEPPPGGWARLLARRRQSSRGWAPSAWWALGTGAAAALIVAWMAVAPGRAEIRMQLTGGRLIGERSEGMGVQMLDDGRAVSLPSSHANVRIYWVEPAKR